MTLYTRLFGKKIKGDDLDIVLRAIGKKLSGTEIHYSDKGWKTTSEAYGKLGTRIKGNKVNVELHIKRKDQSNGMTNRIHYNQDFPVSLLEKNEDLLKIVKSDRNTSASTAILSFIAAVFFLSANATGNIIRSNLNKSVNWIGGVLFIIGLLASLIYLRKGRLKITNKKK